jgi:hypothetical protein
MSPPEGSTQHNAGAQSHQRPQAVSVSLQWSRSDPGRMMVCYFAEEFLFALQSLMVR